MTVKKGAYMYIKWMVPDYGMRGILNGIGGYADKSMEHTPHRQIQDFDK